MKRLAIVAAVLALAACGSENSGAEKSGKIETADGTAEYAQDGGDARMTLTGEDGEVKLATGANQNVDLPAGYSLYPGATVVLSHTSAAAESSSVRVTMSTPASPLQVAEFYRKQATAAGIVDLSEATQGGQLNLVGAGEDGTQFALSATAGQGVTTATLIITKGI